MITMEVSIEAMEIAKAGGKKGKIKKVSEPAIIGNRPGNKRK